MPELPNGRGHAPADNPPVRRVVRATDRVMRVGAAVALFAMALITGADVVGRAAYNTPLFGSEEMVSILAVLTIGLSLPYALRQNAHIGVEVVFRRFSKKTRVALYALTNAASAALFAVVAWRMALYGLTMRKVGVVSMNLGWQTYWVLFVLAGCFGVFALFLAREAALAHRREG